MREGSRAHRGIKSSDERDRELETSRDDGQMGDKSKGEAVSRAMSQSMVMGQIQIFFPCTFAAQSFPRCFSLQITLYYDVKRT